MSADYTGVSSYKPTYEVDANLSWYEKITKRRQVKHDYGLFEGNETYDYDFGRTTKDIAGSNPLDDYKKTGVWRGYEYYNRASTIDYRYIEQMANALSAAHDITIRQGRRWAIDLKKKELEYNPLSLMHGTKGDVMAALLHEIGHLRFTTAGTEFTITGLAEKYPDAAHLVLNLFEDFRIDARMAKSYSGAEGIMESNKETVKKIADNYLERAAQVKAKRGSLVVVANKAKVYDSEGVDKKTLEIFCREKGILFDYVEKLMKMGKSDFVNEMLAVTEESESNLTLHDYLAAVILFAYGHDASNVSKEAQELVLKTQLSIPKVVDAATTQDVLNILEADVYAVIEELLKTYEKGTEKDKEMFDRDGISRIKSAAGDESGRKIKPRTGHGATPDMPLEWREGDYDALRASVESSIKELTRKLQIIKADDLAIKYAHDKRTGKIDAKTLYRWPAGRFDIFKRRQEQKDRTQNFVFSLWVDTSGSMNGDRMIHATRGLIILAETLAKMSIPFEIITFENTTTHYKKYDVEYKGKVLTSVGQLARHSGGGNEAPFALDSAKIKDRPELNKFVIALSDGEMDDMADTKKKFAEYRKQGIHCINVDLSGYGASRALDIEKVVEVDDAGQLPAVFVQAFKEIIKTIKL